MPKLYCILDVELRHLRANKTEVEFVNSFCYLDILRTEGRADLGGSDRKSFVFGGTGTGSLLKNLSIFLMNRAQMYK